MVRLPKHPSPEAGPSPLRPTAVGNDGVVLVRATLIDPSDATPSWVSYLYDPADGSTRDLVDPALRRMHSLWDFNARGQFAGWVALDESTTGDTAGLIGVEGSLAEVRSEAPSLLLRGINEQGVAVGWSYGAGGTVQTAVMAVPVPEPSVVALMGSGGLWLTLTLRRRRAAPSR